MPDYLRGYEITERDGVFYFTDTDKPTAETWQDRPCGHCGLHNTPEGHDGCLGTLPNAMNACCGHGQPDDAYIQLPDGSTIHGAEARDRMPPMIQ